MVQDILDQLVQTTLNTELYGFHHAIGDQSFSNDPFTVSEVLNMSTLSNLWFLSPKNLENIDHHIVVPNSFHEKFDLSELGHKRESLEMS